MAYPESPSGRFPHACAGMTDHLLLLSSPAFVVFPAQAGIQDIYENRIILVEFCIESLSSIELNKYDNPDVY